MGPCEDLMTYLGVPGVGKWGLHSGRSGRLGLGRSKAFSGVTGLASLQPGSAPLPGQALSWPRLLTCLTGEGSLACFPRLCGPLEGSCPAVPRAWWVWEAGGGPGMGARLWVWPTPSGAGLHRGRPPALKARPSGGWGTPPGPSASLHPGPHRLSQNTVLLLPQHGSGPALGRLLCPGWDSC